MGVPALFRWLANKYPKITTNVVEEEPKEINGVTIPIDITQPNPNGDENDYLYLDMNNIIHPCCKPEGKPPPSNEEEMFVAIFAYIERIVNMVRPRKMLYMAIDGVAPRAKMNQQRSRRFRAAQEAKEKAASEDAAWEELTAELKAQRPEHDTQQKFDSNCITPGTPFMVNLGKALRFWVAKKLNDDPGWMNFKVILSDGSVPGEGEHKMMNFIRSQRAAPHHNPNTSHVIYGLDADLIMLALGTHEPYFKVLREDVFFQEGSSKNKCFLCNQTGHQAAQCQGKAKVKSGDFDEKAPATVKPYIYLNVSILREYLEIELKIDNLPFEWDIEKAIDDWVFLCFFVGNDFLPHLPSLETREGAIDILIEIWKQVLPLMGGYVTRSGDVDLKRAQLLMTELGKKEDGIFQERREKEERRMKNNKRRKIEDEARDLYSSKEGGTALSQTPVWNMPAVAVKGLSNKAEAEKEVAALNKMIMEEKVRIRTAANHAAAALLKAELAQQETASEDTGDIAEEGKKANETESVENSEKEPTDMAAEVTSENVPKDITMTESNSLKRKIDEVEGDKDDEESISDEDDDTEAAATPTPIPPTIAKRKITDDEEPEDNVRLWEPDYKERYYRNKFHIELSDTEARRAIVKSYIEGCCWVMKYYMQGCPSWQWYYPYHYSPFASDFVDIGDIEINFDLGQPFQPIEQLMGVLPAASKQHIPLAFQPLMYEEDSPIIDFYPENFELDLNGKKFAWQGVALLPFLDPKRLLDSMAPLYPKLTEEELERNKFGKELLFVSEKSKLYDVLCDKLYSSRSEGEVYYLDYKKSGRLLGNVSRDPQCIPRSSFPSPLVDYGLEDIPVDTSISVIFSNPPLPEGFVHQAVMLKGVNPPKRVLSPDDIQWIKNGGGTQRGGRYGGRGGRGGRGGFNNFGNRGQNNAYQGSFDRNTRGGANFRGGRGGFTPENRGPADRTYPGQSYDRAYPQQPQQPQYGGGSGYDAYNGGAINDGSRFPKPDPYYGYDSRPGNTNYRGGGRGGRGGYGDRGGSPGRGGYGDRGSSPGRGGFSGRGGYGGNNFGNLGQNNVYQGGFDRNTRGGASFRGGRGGFTPENRGPADRTYPGQSYDRAYPQQPQQPHYGGGSGYDAYNGGAINDGSRFSNPYPYYGYDPRPGNTNYRGGGRGGRGGYGDRGGSPGRGGYW